MTVLIPVYSDLNGLHRIELYRETGDGTFRRTGQEPLRSLRDNIVGAAPRCGQLVAQPYERGERAWSTPTVTPVRGEPASLFHFLREQARRHHIMVFSAASLAGRLIRLDMHELELKPSASRQLRAAMLRRYAESMELWVDQPTGAALSQPKAVNA